MPQTTSSTFDFERYTNTPCDYIPAWAILDRKWEIINYSCGWTKEFSDLLVSIESLF